MNHGSGRASYVSADHEVLSILNGLDIVPVQRNAGIDAFLNSAIGNRPIPIRIQRKNDSITDAANKLARAVKSKNIVRAILVRTHQDVLLFSDSILPEFIMIVNATSSQVELRISEQSVEAIRVNNAMFKRRILTK